MTRVVIKLENDLSEVPRLAGEVEKYAAQHSLPDDATFKVTLALDELLTNVLSYAFGDSGAPDITVTLEFDGTNLLVELRDNGDPFDPLVEAPEPDLDAALEDRPIGGLGIHLVKQMMDKVEYERRKGSNCVRLTKRIAP